MQEIGKFSTSSLLTRTTNDVMQVQMLLVLGTEILFKAPMTAIWAIVKIAGKSWQWDNCHGSGCCDTSYDRKYLSVAVAAKIQKNAEADR